MPCFQLSEISSYFLKRETVLLFRFDHFKQSPVTGAYTCCRFPDFLNLDFLCSDFFVFFVQFWIINNERHVLENTIYLSFYSAPDLITHLRFQDRIRAFRQERNEATGLISLTRHFFGEFVFPFAQRRPDQLSTLPSLSYEDRITSNASFSWWWRAAERDRGGRGRICFYFGDVIWTLICFSDVVGDERKKQTKHPPPMKRRRLPFTVIIFAKSPCPGEL